MNPSMYTDYTCSQGSGLDRLSISPLQGRWFAARSVEQKFWSIGLVYIDKTFGNWVHTACPFTVQDK
jgi:hypothetical protein